MQKIIAIMFQFLKAHWKFEALVSTHRKVATLLILASNRRKFICLGRNFTSYFFSLNVHNICKQQRSSGKFRLSKYWLYDKRPVEHAILPFSVFSFLQHWHVSCQNDEFFMFYDVANFYNPETFHIDLQKKPVLFSIISKFRKYEYFISLISRICANGYWSITNWGYIYYQVSKNGSLKMLLCLLGIFNLATFTLI